MNETKDLIVGIDFGKKYSQICCYDRKSEEARSVPVKVGSGQYEMPTLLCMRTDKKEFCVGIEAEYFINEKGGYSIGDMYEVAESSDKITVSDEKMEPWVLLAGFIRGMLKLLGIADVEKKITCISITMEDLKPVHINNLKKACMEIGVKEDGIMLLDYDESFYYYVMTQKIETWNRNVGWYNFEENKVCFRKLFQKSDGKQVFVRLGDSTETELSDDSVERDAEFYAFVKNTLGRDLYSSIQINGEGFDQEWAQKSVKLLCYQKRKVFYGNNLFARGACSAGAERFITHSLKNHRYLSKSMVLYEVGMEVRVMGSSTYYSLIPSGRNWYESSAYIEVIMDDTKELIFVVNDMGESEKKKISMALPGFPDRPNRTTRLGIDLRYISPSECEINVSDLGFGELFPSSGKKWREVTKWQEVVK